MDKDIKVKSSGHLKIFEDNPIAMGRNNTPVYKGNFGGYRPVAVKCLSKPQFHDQKEGIWNVSRADDSPYINKIIITQEDVNFVYVCMALCEYDLHQLVQNKRVYEKFFYSDRFPRPALLELMKDIVAGLKDLHDLRIIHRDLNPYHVLIHGGGALLCGMGYSRRLVGMSSLAPDPTGSTFEWPSPEQILNRPQTLAMDVFNLGCVLFFILTRGNHPFGDPSDRRQRDSNVANNKIVNLDMVDYIPEAKDLLSRLLRHQPEHRPTASDVLVHCLFWSSFKRIVFLSEASVKADSKCSIAIVRALEENHSVVFCGKFDGSWERAFITDMEKHGLSRFDRVQDLLRISRLTIKHYSRLSKETQELFEPYPEGLNRYLVDKFPGLLMVVYEVMHQYCKEEEWFVKYLEDMEDSDMYFYELPEDDDM